jgi:murein DD-endopeptidase MepM/ murein hydrolase activator NlpD
MGNCGKGFPLAFFLLVFFLIPANINRAEDTSTDAASPADTEALASVGDPALAGTPAKAGDAESYPIIDKLDWRDENYKRYIADVEANRRRVFTSRGEFRESASAIADSLTVYRYTLREGENIFFLAARCSIPYSALASINRLNHQIALEPGAAVLLPSSPGIFVPSEPGSDLEFLLASSRFPPEETVSAPVAVSGMPGQAGGKFFFFPGQEFSATERAFFLNTGFQFPLHSYRLTSSYGMRQNPVTGNMRLHQGVDLAAPEGTEVFAAGSGTVTEVGNDPIYGNYVIIKHNDNWASLYGHLQRVGVSLRANVKSGMLIGWVGTTGQSTGPHLHFELRQNGQARDPDKYLFLPGGR